MTTDTIVSLFRNITQLTLHMQKRQYFPVPAFWFHALLFTLASIYYPTVSIARAEYCTFLLSPTIHPARIYGRDEYQRLFASG
jgi:hypothetical protein